MGKAVPVAFPCPLAEIGSPKDLTTQGMNVTLTLSPGETSWDTTFFKVKPGAKINVTANESIFNHTFTIDSLGLNQALPSGKKSSFSFTLPATGPVIFYCIPHRAQGMQGAFYFS